MEVRFYDDGKDKWQSVECYLENLDDFPTNTLGLYSYDLEEITGYGKTRKEAFEDFKTKFNFIMTELKKLEKKVNEIQINRKEKEIK